jgi:hypothetical protein
VLNASWNGEGPGSVIGHMLESLRNIRLFIAVYEERSFT